ncbi:MAG: response regulator [Anaerolineae bacterium]|nr:response regulator [Anaerolineae bacterium]
MGSLRFVDNEVIKVLLVEDNQEHAEMIAMFLEKSNYQRFSLTHVSGLKEAIDQVKTKNFDIALLDLSLPESKGLSTFYSLHARGNGLPIVVLSGTDDELTAVEAMRGGAQDYLVKGSVDHNLIVRAIQYAIERKRTEETLRQREEHFRSLIDNASDLIALLDAEGRFTYASPSHERVLGYQPETLLGRAIQEIAHPDDASAIERLLNQGLEHQGFTGRLEMRLRHTNSSWCIFEGICKVMADPSSANGANALVINSRDITERVQKESELALAYDATLEGWSRALELRDQATEGHSKRVTELTLTLAREMGMSEAEMVHVRRGALLHDIGKMGIPDSILQKGGKLSNDEWEIMEKHPEYAHSMLSPINYLEPALEIPYCHHEKWDGSGYPRGLKAEEIPLSARIFSVIDVWDALVTARPYSQPWSKDEALKFIMSESGKHFDPKVVEAFMKMI